MTATGLLLISVILAGLGQLALKTGVASSGALSFSNPIVFLKTLITPAILLGYALYGASAVIWLIALSRTSLSYAYPFAALTFVFVMCLSWFVLKEPISATRVIGVALICLGFVVASR